jgi:hypothetical protein
MIGRVVRDVFVHRERRLKIGKEKAGWEFTLAHKKTLIRLDISDYFIMIRILWQIGPRPYLQT